MVLCSRCKKRPAVVFVTRKDGDQNAQNEGFCLSCAKEMNLPPVSKMLERFGISDEEVEQMEEQMTEMLATMEEDGDIEGFSPGGAASFPFLQNVFGGDAPTAEGKKEKKEKPKQSNNNKNLEKKLRAVEREVEKQEAAVAEFDPLIEAAAADYQELTRLLQEKADAEANLEELMEQWETLSLEMEG